MPFRSKAQQKLFFAKENRGELPAGTAERWAHHTPDIKALPEKVKKTAAEIAEHVLKTAATKSPSGGGPAPQQLGGPATSLQPNQLQDNISGGSPMGLQSAPPPAGPGMGGNVPSKPPTMTATMPKPVKNAVPKIPSIPKIGAADPFVNPEETLRDKAATPDEISAALWRHYQRQQPTVQEKPIYPVKTASDYAEPLQLRLSNFMFTEMSKLAFMKRAVETLAGGKADGVEDSKLPQGQLAMGQRVEQEHTNNSELAREIARDHVTEISDYYTRLKKMEKSALDVQELLGQDEQRKQDLHQQGMRFEEEKHQLDLQKMQLENQQMQQEFGLKQQESSAKSQAAIQTAQAKMQAAQGQQAPPPDPQQQQRQNIMAASQGEQPQQ